MSYRVGHAVTEEGRQGEVRLKDGSLTLDMREYTPEELYAMAYSACFYSALNKVKQPRDITTDHRIETIIEVDDETSDLIVTVRVAFKDLDEKTSERIAKLADTVCRYSTAVEGNVEKTVEVVPYE